MKKIDVMICWGEEITVSCSQHGSAGIAAKVNPMDYERWKAAESAWVDCQKEMAEAAQFGKIHGMPRLRT